MEAGYGHGRSSALRPLSAGETLDAAIKVYRRNATKLWQTVAVVVIPLEIVELIIRRASLPSDVFVHGGRLYTFTGSTSGAVPVIVVPLIGALVQLLSTGAVFKLVLDAYLGRPTSVGESFRFAASKFLSLLWLSILAFILVVVGFILVIVPGIYLLVGFSVAIPALMMEGCVGRDALKRSRNLVRGRWWATLGRLIVAYLLVAILTIVFGAINVASAFSVTNVTLYVTVGAAVAAVVAILTAPFTAAVATVMYIDLRVRKEALDIELLAGDGQGPAERGVGPSGFGTAPTEDPERERPATIGGWPRNQPTTPTLPGPTPSDPTEGTSTPPPGT